MFSVNKFRTCPFLSQTLTVTLKFCKAHRHRSKKKHDRDGVGMGFQVVASLVLFVLFDPYFLDRNL